MNILDIIAVTILIVGGIVGYSKGLVLSVFNAFSWIVSLVVSSTLYPEVNKIIRDKTDFYDKIKEVVSGTLDFSEILMGMTADATRNIQSQQIESMNLPESLINAFLANNNPEVYLALGAESFEEYMSSFIANGIINTLSVIIIFMTAMLIIKLLGETLNFVAKLPIINTFNKLGGVLAGFIPAIMINFLMFTILSIAFATNEEHMIFTMLNTSSVAKFISANNPVMEMITTVFP